MSADEIRKLAEDCEKEARHIDEDAGIAFSCGDLRMKDVFDAISKTQRQKAAALLAYAAMIDRCENEIAKLRYPPSADDVVDFKRLNYILKGVTNG